MTARLAWTKATVEANGTTYEGVGALLAGTSLVLRDRTTGQEITRLSGVVASRRTGQRSFSIEAQDGTAWTVTRDKDCGCGGGR